MPQHDNMKLYFVSRMSAMLSNIWGKILLIFIWTFSSVFYATSAPFSTLFLQFVVQFIDDMTTWSWSFRAVTLRMIVNVMSQDEIGNSIQFIAIFSAISFISTMACPCPVLSSWEFCRLILVKWMLAEADLEMNFISIVIKSIGIGRKADV